MGHTKIFALNGVNLNFRPGEFAGLINDSPNRLVLSAHHVQVRFLGSGNDVAYVTYHLVGRIERGDGSVIGNYRTRASNLMEKVGGKWVQVGSHYSPLFGGSGVKFD